MTPASALPDEVSVLLDAIEATGTNTVRLYGVQAPSGQLAQRGNYGAWGPLRPEKLYGSVGPARALVTGLARTGTDSTVVEFVAVPATVFDEAARVAKAKKRGRR